MATAESLSYEDELCPNCGEFVPYLHEDTGFCYPCSGIEPTRRCSSCNTILPDDYENNRCNRCRYIDWLQRNADAIERTMSVNGVSASRAKRMVLASNRPICHSCQQPIKGGTFGKHFFCRTTQKCKKASNIYRYNRSKNKSHTESMRKALDAVVIMELLNGR